MDFFCFRLQQVFSFNVKSKNHSANLSESDIEIIGLDKQEIKILVKSKKTLKIINRKTGESSASINLTEKLSIQENEINFSHLQMDLNQSIFLVKDSTNQILYIFDTDFKFLLKYENLDFYRVFKSVEFTCLNDGYFCDRLNKKIHFF